MAEFFASCHGKYIADALVGTESRLLKYDLQFIGPDEPFDSEFVYKVFGRIRETTVFILMGDVEDFIITSKKTKIGPLGISRYYSFAFPSPGEIRCSVISRLNNDHMAHVVQIDPK
jgi:hypothetical protein